MGNTVLADTLLMDSKFEIVHNLGKHHVVADYLSQNNLPSKTSHKDLDKFLDAYVSSIANLDQQTKDIWQVLEMDVVPPKYNLINIALPFIIINNVLFKWDID